MLAIPFFIMAGSLMMHGKFGVYLVNTARFLVGRFRGGLGQVSIIGSVMFGGVSGSAVADASALGNALIPVQKSEGYPGASRRDQLRLVDHEHSSFRRRSRSSCTLSSPTPRSQRCSTPASSRA